MDKLTEGEFLKNVENHIMTVVKDDGVYRHLRFKQVGRTEMYFDLITWPGYLCYTGDMGTYVFSRLTDMFEFFRTDRKDDNKLYINLGYWAEKLEAVDSHGGNSRGATEFSPEKFTRVINDYRVGWMRERSLDKDDRRELWDSVDDEVLSYLDDGEQSVYLKANEFRTTLGGRRFSFRELWDHNFTDYTSHFAWCCYALAWGIKQYDESKP